MRDAGAECIGVDWRLPLSEAVKLIEHGPGDQFAVQGNIDPAVLFAPQQIRRDHVAQVLSGGHAGRRPYRQSGTWGTAERRPGGITRNRRSGTRYWLAPI